MIDGLYCFLNLLDLSEDFFDWSKSFSVDFKIFACCQQSLAETLMLWYAQGFIQERKHCQAPLMSGQDDIACKMGFIMPFICVHLCHNNYIKFCKRVCNWFHNAIQQAEATWRICCVLTGAVQKFRMEQFFLLAEGVLANMKSFMRFSLIKLHSLKIQAKEAEYCRNWWWCVLQRK